MDCSRRKSDNDGQGAFSITPKLTSGVGAPHGLKPTLRQMRRGMLWNMGLRIPAPLCPAGAWVTNPSPAARSPNLLLGVVHPWRCRNFGCLQ